MANHLRRVSPTFAADHACVISKGGSLIWVGIASEEASLSVKGDQTRFSRLKSRLPLNMLELREAVSG